MPSKTPLCRLMLALALPIALSIAACSPHPSTASSIARTERPKLPPIDSALAQRETLPHVDGHETGQLVLIDEGALLALSDLARAGAVATEKLNNRIGGWIEERRCTAARFETGKVPADCPAAN